MTTPSPEHPKLTPANQNPWYILMTLHGEQQNAHRTDGAYFPNFDESLHARNRRDWNRWVAQGLSEKQRTELLAMRDAEGNFRFVDDELRPYNAVEMKYFFKNFHDVCVSRGKSLGLPPPPDKCILSRTHFTRPIGANGLLFPGYIDLTGAEFIEYADFSGSVFYNNAILSETKFRDNVSFFDANFVNAIFADDLFISGEANFSYVKFFSSAAFVGARLQKHASFSNALFLSHIYFFKALFSGGADFLNATFCGDANFSNTNFASMTSFSEAKFRTCPPNFHEATLHSDTDWVEARWPSLPVDPGEAKRHVRYYQRLKQLMEGLKKHEDELNFFAMEMAAQRVVDGGWRSWRGILNGLYGAVSDYGRSILRPALAFFPFFAFSAPVFEQSARVGEGCAPLTGAQAAGVSLATFLSVLPGLKDTINYKCLSTFATFTAGFNAIVGALLLFLIGLALRNRFRMK